MNAARYSTLGSTMLLTLTIAACGTPSTENRAGTNPATTAEAIPLKAASREVELRPGTIIAVRLERALSTVRNRAGDTFAASLDQPIVVDDIEVLPRGTRFSGHVTTSKASGRLEGRAVLGPGAHLKLPWPVDKVYRYRTERIQTLNVGFTPAEERESRVVLWTVAHTKEENFLVANRAQPGVETTALAGARKAPPVSLLTVSIPVQFQISDLVQWAYNHEDSSNLLQQIATREVVRYLVSVDLGEMMSRSRLESSVALRDNIQAAANANRLGARILFVGLQDIHPPVKVAPEYEKVVGAIHQKQAKILAAQGDSIRTNAAAGAQAFMLTNAAEADRINLELTARARANAFTNQLPAFNAAPSVYRQRAYAQALPRIIGKTRKYVLLTTNTQDVIQFDLQDKIGEDWMRLTVPPPKK